MYKPASYTHCFSPVHVNGHIVPCGQCPACLRMKASRQVDCITGFNLDHSDEKIIFLTLTYDNANLPLSLVTFDSTDNRLITPFNVDRYGDVYRDRLETFCMDERRFNWSYKRTSYYKEIDDTVISEKNPLSDSYTCYTRKRVLIPTLSRYDIQLFIKRLRKRYEKYVEENNLPYYPIRHYSVGEYGPQHFRPHYHILLFCKNDIYKWLKRNLGTLWTYGYNYPKRANIGTAKYVAQYICSTSSLPNYLKTSFARPFFIHSNYFYKSLCEFETKTVREEQFANLDGYFYTNNGKQATCLYSLSYISRLFPKPYSYDPRNRQEGFKTLQLYLQFRNYFGVDNCCKLADLYKSGQFPFTTLLPEYLFLGIDKERLLRILYTSKSFVKNASIYYPELDIQSAMLEYYNVITHYYDYVEKKTLSNFYRNQEITMLRTDISDYDKKYRIGNMYLDVFPKIFGVKRVHHTSGKFVTKPMIDPIFGDEIPFSEHTEFIPDSYEIEDKSLQRVNDIVYNFWNNMNIDVFHDIPDYDINNTPEIVSYRSEVKRQLIEDVKHKARNDYNLKYLSEQPINLINIL